MINTFQFLCPRLGRRHSECFQYFSIYFPLSFFWRDRKENGGGVSESLGLLCSGVGDTNLLWKRFLPYFLKVKRNRGISRVVNKKDGALSEKFSLFSARRSLKNMNDASVGEREGVVKATPSLFSITGGEGNLQFRDKLPPTESIIRKFAPICCSALTPEQTGGSFVQLQRTPNQVRLCVNVTFFFVLFRGPLAWYARGRLCEINSRLDSNPGAAEIGRPFPFVIARTHARKYVP